ncbi:MHYT domain-containing protein [Legionella maioricensis]|uniref:histidine kinase n=1 Tax=Legionella maioricensis TaxID=2896528 RepID=A0A9X2CZ90_9GAMM|nr:MHYT domain-containing protein [Legionella maioricensis]MCL9683503.1 GHKL domain-containing protein [Legionella maioricensis]MCL9686802.1 ATP-binding protein [Legionella maioricensis]
MFAQFFQTLPIPQDQLTGTYSIRLVVLSFLVATAASYVALDVTYRMRDVSISKFESFLWLIGGSLAMGAGIWSMHFIGMLAFIMPMPMLYDPTLTGLSIVVAIIASGLALSLLRPKNIKLLYLILGGIVMGFAIAAMHYTGMAAMSISMNIHYLPNVFILSILIAIFASEAALYLAIKSTQADIKNRFLLKIISALIMGAAICGMHYTGMAAAIFTPLSTMPNMGVGENPDSMSVMIAIVTIFILGIAITISSFKEVLTEKSVKIARQSGMAEVASSVLHNVGNVLNSVNVSSSLIKDHLRKIDIQKLADVNNLIHEHQHDLGTFISSDPRGSRLPNYLSLLTNKWQTEYNSLIEEINRLEQNIQHIKEIIALQQSFSGIISFSELISIEKLIDEALTLAGINFSRHKIIVNKEYIKFKKIHVDKLKLTQVLINLIYNAKEAVIESRNKEKIIRIKAGPIDESSFFIQVIDNGIGIEKAHQSQIFSYGYTTKKSGHGFGLHSSIIAINEMKGSLEVASEGVNKGATFTIKLPYKAT